MKRFLLPVLTCSTLALSSLTSCAAPQSVRSASPQPELAQVESDSAGGALSASDAVNTEAADTASRPQLIKRAQITLGVDSIDESYDAVRQIIRQQQGDLLSLTDQNNRDRTLRFQLRVPQDRLDATLEDLTALGIVRNQSITTEDVSNQLVDLRARLSNERKSEEALQKLMERSGDVSDILEVSRELSNVRENIERMDAQLTSLTTQVSYSTIGVSLESAIAATTPQTPIGRQLSNTWSTATSSFGSFTTGLLQMGLWLLVYSPYLFVVFGAAALLKRSFRSSSQRASGTAVSGGE